VNIKRTTRTCFQCGKPGHFVIECLEKMDNKDGYKHRSSIENKHQLRRDHKHKQKNKDEQRSRRNNAHGKKAREMVGASVIDSSSAYSTSSSSSSEDEVDWRTSKKASKNLSRMSYFA
jgi:hypothetical protein